jgi:hypothetical protein
MRTLPGGFFAECPTWHSAKMDFFAECCLEDTRQS